MGKETECVVVFLVEYARSTFKRLKNVMVGMQVKDLYLLFVLPLNVSYELIPHMLNVKHKQCAKRNLSLP